MSSANLSQKLTRSYSFLCFLIFLLIILGGAVRSMNAGLACPDWPLCFGDIIPDYHLQVYLEFLHRVLAGFVALLVVILNIKILRSKPKSAVQFFCWFSFVVLFVQVIMGGLTVLMKLHAQIVTLHLVLGLTLFSSCLWIYRSLKPLPRADFTGFTKVATVVLFLTVCTQIILGGLVASHYAALVCSDFPLCHGSFIPTFKGVIGLQVLHRLGAYVTFFVAFAYFIFTYSKSLKQSLKQNLKQSLKQNFIKKQALYIFLLVFTQACVGISNILFSTPPLITVIHLGLAAIILSQSLKLLQVCFSVEKQN